MSQPEIAVNGLLARASRRLTLLAAVEGAAVGFGTALLLSLAGWPSRGSAFTPLVAGILAAVVGAVARGWMSSRARGSVAAHVERAAPESRNLLFTASELASAPPTPIHELILAQAGTLAGRLDPARLFPVGRRWIVLSVAAIAWVGGLALATDGAIIGPPSAALPGLSRVDVTLTPPAYTGLKGSSMRDPDRITLLAGTRIELSAATSAPSVTFATMDTNIVAQSVNGIATASFVGKTDGLVTIQPQGTDTRRLIGISVNADAPPTVRIASPGKDMLVPDGKRTLDVGIEADDDIGLSTLILRYTKVSGSGERFTFKDADVPIEISRLNTRTWTAAKKWAIESLNLESGDMLVYRAIATDARPGAAPVESDAFIVEIIAPGGLAEAGYSVDPDEERTALSQQMVVLKTQRLIAEGKRLAQDTVLAKSQDLSSEQRRVRAEFVFLMGGEMSDGGANDSSMTDIDETTDAAAEEDLMAGRQLNQGRIALLRAIRAMSLAARSLNEADLNTALTYEREAVKQIELAFSRNRILLRAFSQREALDTTRRLSGDMSDLARAARATLPADSSARVNALRHLATEASLAASTQMSASDRARFAGAMAEGVLRVDPGAKGIQAISRDFTDAANAWRANRERDARSAFDKATAALNTALSSQLPSSAGTRGALSSTIIDGVRVDLLQRRRP